MVRHNAPSLLAPVGEGFIDIAREFSWKESLTDRQRLFVFYYLYPVDNDAYHIASRAVKKARFHGDATVTAAKLLNKDNVRREIANIGAQVNKIIVKVSLNEHLSAFIAQKLKRLKVVALDFYNFQVKSCDDNTYVIATPKLPEELTPEQREMVLDVEFVGNRGILHYKLPNKIDVENELIRLIKDFAPKESGEGYEVEATADIIKGQLQLKAKVMRSNLELSKLAGLDDGAGEREE